MVGSWPSTLTPTPLNCASTSMLSANPRLAGPARWLRFNVSHTEDAATFAVAHSREVGVDVERIREDVLADR